MAEDNAPGQGGQAFVRRALEAAELADRLRAAQPLRPAAGFAELYAYATRPDYAPRRELLDALEEDERVRGDFAALLRNVSVFRLPRVAAASGDEVSTREVDGCRITFRESRAEASQVFVIIDLADDAAPPRNLFVCGEGRAVQKTALPAPQDGRIQLLLEAGSDLARGLRDIDTEVFLR